MRGVGESLMIYNQDVHTGKGGAWGGVKCGEKTDRGVGSLLIKTKQKPSE